MAVQVAETGEVARLHRIGATARLQPVLTLLLVLGNQGVKRCAQRLVDSCNIRDSRIDQRRQLIRRHVDDDHHRSALELRAHHVEVHLIARIAVDHERGGLARRGVVERCHGSNGELRTVAPLQRQPSVLLEFRRFEIHDEVQAKSPEHSLKQQEQHKDTHGHHETPQKSLGWRGQALHHAADREREWPIVWARLGGR